ncbi:MAG: oligosaccharide flippase family protein [Polyangiaceae bacterium]|nr:oligosaccharide flippase family protein [Polyangiaceae bacterium]
MAKAEDASPNLPVPHDQIRRNAFRSTLWIGIGFGAGQVVRLASSVVLTRLIHPEVYGLMDLVVVVSMALALFSDIGIAPSVIQNPRGEERAFLDTAWTLQLLRGVVLFVVSLLVAYPVSLVYGRPILAYLIPAVGFGAVIDGLLSTSLFILARHVRNGPMVVFELVGSVVTFIVTFVVVYLIHPDGVRQIAAGTLTNLPFDESLCWAVVFGALAARLVNVVLSFVAIAHPWPRPTWDRRALREIFSFGKWVFLSTMLTFLAMYTDRMLVPKLIDFEAGGLYGRAIGLLAIPVGLLIKLASTVVFPFCSRLHERGEPVGPAASKIYLSSGVASSLFMSGLIACGPAVVAILYPPTYADVGWLLQLVAVVGWIQSQANTGGWVLLGCDCRPALTTSMAVKIVALVLFVWPAVWVARQLGWSPLTGLILGFGIAELARYVTIVYFAARLRFRTWQRDILLAPIVIAVAYLGIAVGGWLYAQWAGVAVPTTRLGWLPVVILQGSVVTVIWGTIAGVLYRFGLVKFR